MSLEHRSGGKYTGTHSTLIPLAAITCDIANALRQVTKIRPGFLKQRLKSHGHRRVKFSDESKNCILLSILENASHQEVWIYVDDIQTARTALAGKLRDVGIAIAFRKD